MDQKTINWYFNRIIKALNGCKIKLVKQPKIKGENVDGWHEPGLIHIKKSKKENNLILALIHEGLHEAYQYLPERQSPREFFDLLSCELYCYFSTEQYNILKKFLR